MMNDQMDPRWIHALFAGGAPPPFTVSPTAPPMLSAQEGARLSAQHDHIMQQLEAQRHRMMAFMAGLHSGAQRRSPMEIPGPSGPSAGGIYM